jgi:hypothetical protein
MVLLLLGVYPIQSHAQDGPKQPVIFELVVPPNGTIKFGRFASMKGYGIKNIQQWHNRVVVYAETDNQAALNNRLVKDFPQEKVILFAHPFYDFERKYCTEKKVAGEWTNVILTANLVKDPKMQQEYLNYHATQFQKWPEVSQGFCNADFQRLLVFKTGRQLMLMISIPKGKTLDELNPLTTKNNPRVDDWNKMMEKYQEGIEGTKKGEVWVFFKDVDQRKFIE